MANFTAADVKRLRELTGAGMLACKNALAETDGDFDKAVEALRIKGAKDVGKRAERATAEGLVAAKDGALIELNCETDFVAKNAEFQTLADQVVAAAAAAKPADVDALKGASIGDKTVEQAIAELSAKIGEKLELRRVAIFDGTVEAYLHRRSADLPPAVGVLVEYRGDDAAAAHALRCKSPRCGRGTCPATTCLKTSWPANAASPRRRQGPRASRSRRCPRLSRAG
ncbi:elongation factor Ts [Mycobacterium tuberculosis]|nr:elongation factor Ts [Mycobacterium tuberculosis]